MIYFESMPPCGNFGLAFMPVEQQMPICKSSSTTSEKYRDGGTKIYPSDGEYIEVEENKSSSSLVSKDPISVLPLLNILQSQAAWTEFRGGLIINCI